MSFQVLPGKLAIQIEPHPQGEIAIPDFVLAKQAQLEMPPYELLRAVVYDSGCKSFRKGDVVWVKPTINGGLVLEHNDTDHPQIGKLIPKDHEIWIYRDYEDQVLFKETA